MCPIKIENQILSKYFFSQKKTFLIVCQNIACIFLRFRTTSFITLYCNSRASNRVEIGGYSLKTRAGDVAKAWCFRAEQKLECQNSYYFLLNLIAKNTKMEISQYAQKLHRNRDAFTLETRRICTVIDWTVKITGNYKKWAMLATLTSRLWHRPSSSSLKLSNKAAPEMHPHKKVWLAGIVFPLSYTVTHCNFF